MSNYFPYGFTYPKGFAYSDSNPDPGMEAIRKRMEFLNICHDACPTMEGHFFAAALALFQSSSDLDVDLFWDEVQDALTPDEVAQIALSLEPMVQDELPRLDFPNAIALFDCRFVSIREWQHIRRYSIGGSEAAAVLGLSEYQTQRGLFYEKKRPPTEPHSASQQQIFDYGHCVEDFVVERAALPMGAIRWPEYRMFAHRKYPHITCNPDGILYFPQERRFALFEAKTAIRWKKDDWRNDIPSYYVPQPRQYLEVLDDPKLTGGYIGCCFGGLPTDWICHDYIRDKAAGAAQIEAVNEYWQTYIVPGVIPPVSGKPELDREALYLYEKQLRNDKAKDPLPDSTLAQFEEYFELRAQREALAKDIKLASAQEQDLLQQIKLCVPEGLTLCSVPNGLTYKIKVSDYVRESVDTTKLDQADHDAHMGLWHLACAMKESNPPFTTPKITKTKPVTKAPKTRKKAVA